MKLWTLQHREFVASASGNAFEANWEHTSHSWRGAYQWMARQWHERIGPPFGSAPIWCWHSCDGERHSPPTVGTASALLSDSMYYSGAIVLVEINVPEHLGLLSSYAIWNAALDDYIEHKRHTIDDRRFVTMFDEPLIRYPGDSVQAVIPLIRSDWILDIRELPETDDDWDALL